MLFGGRALQHVAVLEGDYFDTFQLKFEKQTEKLHIVNILKDTTHKTW